MEISELEFRAKINITPLEAETVTVTGGELLSWIARANVITPQLLRLKEGYVNLDPSKKGFDQELTAIAIAQETEKLSTEIDSSQILALEGIATLTKLAAAWDEVNQLTLGYINQLQADSQEYNKRLLQLQGQEQKLNDAKMALGIFSQLRESTG